MANENVTHAPFQRAQLGSIAEEIRTVIYSYVNRASVAGVNRFATWPPATSRSRRAADSAVRQRIWRGRTGHRLEHDDIAAADRPIGRDVGRSRRHTDAGHLERHAKLGHEQHQRHVERAVAQLE